MLKVYPKTAKVLLISCLFLRKLLCSHWLLFWKIAGKKFTELWKVSRSRSEKIRFYGSYWSFAFLRKIFWTRETQFLKRCKSFFTENQKFSRWNSKLKYNHFCQKLSSLEKLFWRHKLRFWAPFFNKTTAKDRKAVRWKSENNLKNIGFFFNEIFDYGETQCIFDSSTKKNTTYSFIIFHSSSEINHKKFGFFYLKAKLSYNVSLVT